MQNDRKIKLSIVGLAARNHRPEGLRTYWGVHFGCFRVCECEVRHQPTWDTATEKQSCGLDRWASYVDPLGAARRPASNPVASSILKEQGVNFNFEIIITEYFPKHTASANNLAAQRKHPLQQSHQISKWRRLRNTRCTNPPTLARSEMRSMTT